MKHKVFSFVAAAVLTAGIFTAIPTAATPTKEMDSREAAKVLANMCAAGYKEWRLYGQTTFIDNALKRQDKESRQLVAIICYAYGKGFEDGRTSVRLS